MEPFIQLTYNKQCPLKTSQPTETSFIDKRKVNEHFWLDLLQRKCPEGLGEVSESLLTDGSLTQADFSYKQDVSLDICTSQQDASYNDCLSISKIVNTDKFKTPLTSKYKNNNISETPCLFSQDESITQTPASKSQPTCHGDTSNKSAEESSSSTQVLSTPVASSIYISDWSKKTTPDILAEIMGQRTSTLSCLLAGGNDDDIAEWSESMATPPLKIKAPAGDEDDSEAEDAGETTKSATEGEDQPTSKRIARVLFSGPTTNHSMDPVELSMNDTETEVLPVLEDENATLNTTQTTDNSCREEEFLLEYSYHDESRDDVKSLSETLNEDPLRGSPSVNRRPQSRVFSPSSPTPNLLRGPNTFLSPTTKTPFIALAQSTPKPVVSECHDIETKPKTTCTDLIGIARQDPYVTRHYSTSVPSNSLNGLCDKAHDVAFGSPSRSFELAMALEADKLGSEVEKDSRTSGLGVLLRAQDDAGSSLYMSLNAQSSNNDQVMLNNTSSQLTEDLQKAIKTPPNKADLPEEANEKTNSNSAESTTRSADDHCNLSRRKSVCKVLGLRRPVRTKRFSYPSASNFAKQTTGKHTNNDATTADFPQVVEEEKSIIEHSLKIDTSSPKGREAEMPMPKRLKSDEERTFCDSKRDVGTLSSAVNYIQKDDVLFDMDALSQFPVECICSPPSLNSLNGHIATMTVQQRVLSSENNDDLREITETNTQEIDASIVSGAEDTVMHSVVVHSEEKTSQKRNNKEESEVTDIPFPSANLQRKIEISDKALNCAHALLEELDLPTVRLTSQECTPTTEEVVDVDTLYERADLTKEAKGMALENHDGISTTCQAKDGPVIERNSLEVDGNVEEVKEQRAAHKCIAKTDNISGLGKQESSAVSGFCGFSTASGKLVHISESAMKQARKTLSEIDAELSVDDGGQIVTLKVRREKEPYYNKSNNQRSVGNRMRNDHSLGPTYGTSQFRDMPQSDLLNIDASETNALAIEDEKDMALQNSEQAVNELKCKQSESVNDSLLEDLLNDCKRKRRNSLATIYEENEGIEEHHGRILTNTEKVSDLTRRHSGHRTGLNPGTPRVLFKTVSGNPVFVSEEALNKEKATCNKVEGAYKPRHDNPESLNGLRAVPAGDVDNLPGCLNIAKDPWSLTAKKMIEDNAVLNDGVLNTAEGAVNKINQDFVSEDQNKSWTPSERSCGFKKAIGRELFEAPIAKFSGFQTAGGKKVTLSEESLKRGRDIMKRIAADSSEGLQENTDRHSASGKHHCASKDAEGSLRTGAQIMQKTGKKLGQSGNKPGPSTTSLTSFSGFQTAAGKSVTFSKEMLEKGAAIMQQIDRSLEQNRGTSISNSPNTSIFSGFQTASGQSVKLSKESMVKGAAIMHQIDRSFQDKCNDSASATSFSGFQTASGQSVTLSKESMEKGAAIMQQIDRSLQENSVELSHNASSFSGFQTASGQSVKLSKESLEKGAAILQQIDRSLQDKLDDSVSATSFSGFQTAGGQSVKLSKESMEKGAAIMQQIDRSLQDKLDNSVSATSFSGFQTASGQSVKLSKESMEKGAAIMQQIDRSLQDKLDNSVSATSFSGFQTAGGQSVKLSKESMEKGAAIMQQIDRSFQEIKDNRVYTTGFPKSKPSSTSFSGLSGFQTAGGKMVEISESALAKAKETMADIDRELQTTNTETVAVFRDVSIKTREQISITERENQNYGGNFEGCFTAGGQRVSVSEQALTKAKAFLQETDSTFNDSKTKDAEHEHVAATDLRGRTMSTSGRSCSVEHDEAVSREVLESSKALLAYESVMDTSDASGYLHDEIAVGWSSFNTSGASFLVGMEKGPARASHGFPRRCSTPLRCGEDMCNSSHRETRDGMKPCLTTPSGKVIYTASNYTRRFPGVLHDRRARLHAPLRARMATVDSSCSPRGSDGNRCLKPLRAMTPGCLKSEATPSPSTSTPLTSSANRRKSGPRPQFITPYRKQEVSKDVSPLARCSSSSIRVSVSVEPVHGTDVVEPSSKKPRISASNRTMDVKDHVPVSKTDDKVKPQPGFLSQLRLHNRRIKLKDFVGRGTLPGQFTKAELAELGLSPEVISVSSCNAESFRFVGRKYFSESVVTSGVGVRTEDGGMLHAGIDGCVGLEEIQRAFLSTPGVDGQLISEQWIANHYRWVVWKLAAMEVAFPGQFAGRCLTPDWVLCQLKYRYDREIDNSNRSALKKILERDDTSSRAMVLCVSSDTVAENQVHNTAAKQTDNDGQKDRQSTVNKMEHCAVIEVTDGWYGIQTILDRPLTRLLHDGKITVGQKLFVYGAELIGSEQAVSPLEAPSSLMLRLHANSTRRARWDVKLGFHSHAHAFPLPLASLFGDGGLTGCVDVIVLRQYPVQWMEKMSDGTNVFRNSRLEEREAKKFEADREKRREKLFVKIQEEFEKECQLPEKRRSARFRRRSFSSRELKDLNDGKEIYETLTQASDPDSVKECLDERQVRALEDYRRSIQERKCAELQSKFERVWKEQEEEQRQLQRNVVPLLKVRIADYFCKGQARQSAVLSIWRPSEEVMHLLREGSRLRIYHLTAAGVRNRQGASEIQLSATRTTRYEELPSHPDVQTVLYIPRQACSFDELRFGSLQSFSEVDVVGVVVFCSPLSTSPSSSMQTVYLSDQERNLVAIKFWGGLKAVAVEDLIKPRSFICCSNLTVRPDDRVRCPTLSFTDLSTLTLKPREPHLRTALHNLHQSIPDMNIFMCHIQQTLKTLLCPKRVSPSVDLKVNTVRMYGRSSDSPSSRLQDYNPYLVKQSTDVTDSVDSTNRENGSPSVSGQECRLAGFSRSTSGENDTLLLKLNVSSVDEPANLVTPGACANTKSRQSKRKLLDSIAEPPPLSPLPSSIPASVRREFKRPRQVGMPGNIRVEQ